MVTIYQNRYLHFQSIQISETSEKPLPRSKKLLKKKLCNGNAVDVQEGKRKLLTTPLELHFFQQITPIIIEI